MVRNITKTLCTLAPMMERSFDMFCLSTKKLYRTNVFVFIALYRTPKLPGQFCQEEEDMKITHLSMFTNWRGVSQTTLVWIDMTGSRFPFFSNVGHYAVYCNGNWSPTLIQGGGTPTLFGIHFACIETMKHETYSSSPSMHWNWTTTDVSQSAGQFKSEAAVQG